MKKLFLLFAFIITLSFINLKAQQDDMMKAWMEYMTPGEAHSGLAAMSGDWKMVSTMWMDPAAPPQTSEGTCKNEMVFGGRYLKMTASASMMGMPFTGEGVVGYDNAAQVYQSTWYDNLGTGVMFMEGTMDPASKTITFKGSLIDPSTKKKVNMRETVTMESSSKFKMIMYCDRTGKETKEMEIVYTK